MQLPDGFEYKNASCIEFRYKVLRFRRLKLRLTYILASENKVEWYSDRMPLGCELPTVKHEYYSL